MRKLDSEGGASTVEMVAVGAVALALVGALVTGGVVERAAAACVAAICQLLGGDCAVGGGPPGAGVVPAVNDFTDGGGGGVDDGFAQPPPRPPIPRPECNSDPDVPWTEGLHSHNDYENGQALQDALDHGATSVEVDVWLDENGDVVVKHLEGDDPRGTLRDQYVDPLNERVEQNGGQVYPGRDEPFQILVEMKTVEDAPPGYYEEVYQQTMEELGDLPPGSVQVVFDGANRPDADGNLDAVATLPPGFFYNRNPATEGDGCHIPPELDPDSPDYDREYAQHVTMLNGGFGSCADLDDDGEVDDQEQQQLNRFVEEAHAAGYEVRMVEGPDWKQRKGGDDFGEFKPCPFWDDKCNNGEDSKGAQDDWFESLREAGVDYIDTQHLTAGRDFLRNCGG